MACSFYLVVAFELSELEVGAFLEFLASAASATSVDTSHDVAMCGECLFPIDGEGVENLLRARTAILVHEDRILA